MLFVQHGGRWWLGPAAAGDRQRGRTPCTTLMVGQMLYVQHVLWDRFCKQIRKLNSNFDRNMLYVQHFWWPRPQHAFEFYNIFADFRSPLPHNMLYVQHFGGSESRIRNMLYVQHVGSNTVCRPPLKTCEVRQDRPEEILLFDSSPSSSKKRHAMHVPLLVLMPSKSEAAASQERGCIATGHTPDPIINSRFGGFLGGLFGGCFRTCPSPLYIDRADHQQEL